MYLSEPSCINTTNVILNVLGYTSVVASFYHIIITMLSRGDLL